MSPKYQLYCQQCTWKRFTDGTDLDDLYEVKTTPIQHHIPKINKKEDDEEDKPEYKDQKRRFKCPQCGFTVFPKKLNEKNITDRNKTSSERL